MKLQTHLEYIPTPFVTSRKQRGTAKTNTVQLRVKSAGNRSRRPAARGTTLLPRDTCQPGHSSQKPATTQGCARVFTCIGQKKLGRLCFRLSPTAPDTRQEGWCLWMSPGCSNPPGDSHKTDRKHGVRGITAQLREGNASHSSGCTTWCNQLYPKHGERDPQSPSPRRAGSHPPGASVRKDVQAAAGVTGQEHSISCWTDGSRINEHTLNSQRR